MMTAGTRGPRTNHKHERYPLESFEIAGELPNQSRRQVWQLRQPALRLLFPSRALGLESIAVPAHDGEFHTVIDIWPRPTCYYATEYRRNEEVQDGSIPKWNYCVNPPADQQIRGSANAPRPNVPNNGAQMPPGVDPNERTPIPVN